MRRLHARAINQRKARHSKRIPPRPPRLADHTVRKILARPSGTPRQWQPSPLRECAARRPRGGWPVRCPRFGHLPLAGDGSCHQPARPPPDPAPPSLPRRCVPRRAAPRRCIEAGPWATLLICHPIGTSPSTSETRSKREAGFLLGDFIHRCRLLEPYREKASGFSHSAPARVAQVRKILKCSGPLDPFAPSVERILQ